MFVYEFGNSAFHVSMPALLERFPGVVGLHDAYLSGLFRYMATARGHPEEYGELACEIVSNTMLNGTAIRLDGALRMPPR